MVQTCYICKWRADKEPRRSFHKFPYDEAEKQKWLDIIGKSHVSLGKRTSICSIHFEKSCFRYGLVNGRELLRPGSLPTVELARPPEADEAARTPGGTFECQVDIKIELEPESSEQPAAPADPDKRPACSAKPAPRARPARPSRPARPPHVRRLLERLRRDHARLKNYIRALEERRAPPRR